MRHGVKAGGQRSRLLEVWRGFLVRDHDGD